MLYDIVKLTFVVVLLAIVIWQSWSAFRRSEQRAWLVAKWIASALILCLAVFILGPRVESGLVFIIVPMLAACGVLLGILWAPQLAALVSRPLESFYWGNASAEEQALYAIAQAHCKRGRYQMAIAEIERQLAAFPQDVEGQLLLAKIQAEHLGNLPAAEAIILAMINQEGHSPQVIAHACNQLAEWRVNIGKDIEGARQALSQIPERFPGTELAYLASQRIAHLVPQQVQQIQQSRTYAVPHTDEYVGLRDDFSGMRPVEKSPHQVASELVQRLNQEPHDNETREQLAIVYARELHRMDLAVEQIEQLLAQPGVPLRKMAQWYHLLTDLQIQCAGNLEQARLALQTLIESFPQSIEADKARNRLNLLALEMKGQQKSQAIKLGSYDQRLGLKHGPPKRPGA